MTLTEHCKTDNPGKSLMLSLDYLFSRVLAYPHIQSYQRLKVNIFDVTNASHLLFAHKLNAISAEKVNTEAVPHFEGECL